MNLWKNVVATLKKSNLLVVGGTGFIGHHLLKAANFEGYQLTSISLNPPSLARYVKGVSYLHFDFKDQSQIQKHIDGNFEYIVNLWQEKRQQRDIGVDMLSRSQHD